MILFPNCTADESPCYPLRYPSVRVREVEGENDLGVAVCGVSKPMAAAPDARVIKLSPAGCLRFFMYRDQFSYLPVARRLAEKYVYLGPVWLALISAGAGLGNQWEPPSGSTAPVGCYWGYE